MYTVDQYSPADRIFYNANVITLEERQPQAELVAIRKGKILGVGDKDDLAQFKGKNTELIDCEGRTIVPGFNDAHCHPLSFATTLVYVDCSSNEVKKVADIQDRIQEKVKASPPGKWIRGAHYDGFHLREKRPPNRQELDEVAPENPVILIHRTGQDCVLNSLALHMAGISRDTPDPSGGTIHREPGTGNPNGLISGRNENLEKTIPPLDVEELQQGIKLANKEYLSLGITSIQDTSWTNGLNHWKRLQKFVKEGFFRPRLSVMVGTSSLEEFQSAGLSMGYGDNRLRIGGIKISIDDSTGCPNPPQEEINHIALKAHQAGFQMALHVSDVYMLQASLSAVEFVLQEMPWADHRHRLEHCAVCPPGLVHRLKTSGALVIMQPSFLYHMGQRYLDEVPSAQLDWLYPIASFQSRGIHVAFSSDSPFMPANPFIGIYSAVTRKVGTGRTLSLKEAIPPLEALKMYTLCGAYATMEERIKGSISPGKLADMAILNGNPLQVSHDELLNLKVIQTIINGEVEWEN